MHTSTVEFAVLRSMQRRVAMEAIGPSTLRRSKPGTAAAVHIFLAELDLAEFARAAQTSFADAHCKLVETLRLVLAGKELSCEFGRCAKAIDIFLRSVVVHHHLREACKLEAIEGELRVPLDSFTMAGIAQDAPSAKLRPKAICKLTPNDYARFQAAARCLAAKEGLAAVFLDDRYWAQRKQPEATIAGAAD